MRRRWLLAAAVMAASALTASCALPSGTGSSGGAAGGGPSESQGGNLHSSCTVHFDPIAIETVQPGAGLQVGGSAWATCLDAHLPSEHHMVLNMEYQRLSERGTNLWDIVATNYTDQIPRDALTRTHQPVTVIVHTPCVAGVFRMFVTTTGRMPDTGPWTPYTDHSATYTIDNPNKCKKVT